MLDDFSPIVAAHRHSSNHRAALVQSRECGCFYCLEVYPPSEIVEWIDEDSTALCPKCGIDSVIGTKSGHPVTREFLELMRRHWFGAA